MGIKYPTDTQIPRCIRSWGVCIIYDRGEGFNRHKIFVDSGVGSTSRLTSGARPQRQILRYLSPKAHEPMATDRLPNMNLIAKRATCSAVHALGTNPRYCACGRQMRCDISHTTSMCSGVCTSSRFWRDRCPDSLRQPTLPICIRYSIKSSMFTNCNMEMEVKKRNGGQRSIQLEAGLYLRNNKPCGAIAGYVEFTITKMQQKSNKSLFVRVSLLTAILHRDKPMASED